MIKARSPVFWLLALLCVGLGAWWLLHVPYAPQRLFSAIPSHAAFVSEHKDAAGRWDALSHNPVTLTLFTSLGVEASELQGLKDDPESAKWLRKLASKDLVLAYVAHLGDYHEPTWVFASWLGGRSQRMRWALSLREIAGFEKRPSHRGHPYWEVDAPFLRSDLKLRIAFVEGMLVGCLAQHESAMREVLDTSDGVLPSLVGHRRFPSERLFDSKLNADDRGWLNVAQLKQQSGYPVQSLVYELNVLTRTTTAGRLSLAASLPPSEEAKAGLAASGLEDVFGQAPIGLAMFDPHLILPGMESRKAPHWVRAAAEVIRQHQPAAIALGFFGGDYSGRFKGMKVPAFVVAVPVSDAEAAEESVRNAIDGLNVRRRWGLFARQVDGSRVRVIDGSADPAYAALDLNERPAYAVSGGWLLMGTNLETVRKLITPRVEDEYPAWQKGLELSSGPLYLWIDLAQGDQTFRSAISAYSLKLMLEDPAGSQPMRQRMSEARAWISALAPLEECRFWVSRQGEDVDIRFQAGHSAEH